MRHLKQASRHLDLFSPHRVKSEADVFGETPVVTVVSLVQIAESYLDRPLAQFVDLGCGRGVTCLTASCLGIPSLGFEREAPWVEVAVNVATTMSLPANFQSGDFMAADWPAEATFLVIATAYPDEMRAEIAGRLRALGGGVSVITGDWELSDDDFECLWRGVLPVDWGKAAFALWVVRRSIP